MNNVTLLRITVLDFKLKTHTRKCASRLLEALLSALLAMYY